MAALRCAACALSWVGLVMAQVPTPSPSPQASGGGFGKRSGKAGWLDDHNHFRSLHGADPVTWDDDLEKKAIKHAQDMESQGGLSHSASFQNWPPSCENVAGGYGSSCSSPHRNGGPKLYDGGYDQHCVVAGWYGEYYLWKGRGDWQNISGIGHFTAMVWKGSDTIGCATAGHSYVCEYGSKHCRNHEEYGGADCFASTPSHLPNFNTQQCSGGRCIQGLFTLSSDLEDILHEPVAGAAGMLAWCTGLATMVAGAGLLVRRLRAQAWVANEGDMDLLCAMPAPGLEA